MTLSHIIRGVVISLLLLIFNFAHAIGDSAGGCGRGGTPLEIKAIAGIPKDLEIEIDRGVSLATSFAIRNLNLLNHPNYHHYAVWISPRIFFQSKQNKRTFFINWWSACGGARLLDLAAAGGNQNIAQYLLNAGANPNIVDADGNTIFMRCGNLDSDKKSLSIDRYPSPTRSKMEAEGKLTVYSQLLARGGDLNRGNRNELTALYLCNDPEAIAFFLKNGANPNRNTLLAYRIKRILEDYDWERDANFSILEQLIPVTKDKTLEREALKTICYQCSNPRKAETCNRLSKMIEVPDQDIFSSKEQGDKYEVAREKCREY